jgi:putative colanic acid biosysnthesis UDP-glucose lipid carrier transferase
MEKNIYKGNILIRRLVVLVDFIILNCLLLGFINIEFIHVPDYLDLKTKITFFIANFLGSFFVA